MNATTVNPKCKLLILWLAAAVGLGACSSGGAPTTPSATVAPMGTANAYTGPPPATADVQAFAVSFWNNVRGQDRCGQCHNATTPGQMPNFARSDDVNLAYAQANTVINLQDPAASQLVQHVAGGHNCWLPDNNACAQILTTWISNWAGASAGGGTKVKLTAPAIHTVGESLNFPADPTDFANTVYPLLTKYCSRCHSPTAAVPQAPYFASSDLNQAYQQALSKIDLNTPANSRFYLKLATESHNCWDVCANDAAQMLAAIQTFAGMLTPTSIDPALVVSKALTLADGIVASGNNRFDQNVIAKYEFQTGSGNIAYDTSGVDPAADLTLSGPVTWAGGWGIQIAPGGKAQASTAASKKIFDLIQSTGEFTIEAWVAPASLAADNSYMVSYSGGDAARNFTLGQTNQNYDFLLRSTGSDLNGMPQLSTPDGTNVLQAALQHVVLTYDPVNGRRIYVNGVQIPLADPQKGDAISNWNASFALVLGNEVSGDRPWSGLIKFVAIHDRALTPAQVLQNFQAGVGQRYFMLFNVADVTGVPQSYVMFTVSQYDSYSYLFAQPTFISLDPTVTPDGIVVKGIRIGIDGTIPNVGQAFIPLDTTVTAANYTAQGEVLSPVGTVIALQNPATDQFFLTFDQLGTQTHVVVEPAPPPPPTPGDLPPSSAVGLRTFAQINATMSQITGVPTTQAAVNQTYLAVQQQLPALPNVQGFVAADQVGIAQLAIQYCSVMVNTPSLAAQMFPGVNFNASLFSTPAGVDSVTGPIAARVLGSAPNGAPLASQPAASTVSNELDSLVGTLCGATSPCNNTPRVLAVASAACAAALGSADMLID
ncbi:MAG TPA: LamG domain-containing protein [Steroidobacteraceae bacterium]|nr:LamG domain-containing protein [Steroidobacteraceae bacterium]